MIFVISGESIVQVHKDEVRMHYMQSTEGVAIYLQTNITWFKLDTYETHQVGLREYKALLDHVAIPNSGAAAPTIVVGKGYKPVLDVAIFNEIVDANLMRAYPNGQMVRPQIEAKPVDQPAAGQPQAAEKEPALD